MKKFTSYLLIFFMGLAPVLSVAAQDPATDTVKVKKSRSPKLKQVRVKQKGGTNKKGHVKLKNVTPVPQENVTDQVEVSQQSNELSSQKR